MTIAGGRPVFVRAGTTTVFEVAVFRPATSAQDGVSGHFFDPNVGGGQRPAFPLGFGEIRDGRCNHDFSVDFVPVPNFGGWFGAFSIAPGETLRCRIEVSTAPNPRLGTHPAGLTHNRKQILFDVVVYPSTPTKIPGPGRPAVVTLAFLMLCLALVRLQRQH